MKTWLAKTALSLMGGISGLVEMIINWFNESVLQKIKDKEEFAAYAEDVSQFAYFLDGVFTRHEKWMSEAKRSALVATINAVRDLAAALKDCKVTKEEIDALIDVITACIEAWKKAK